MLQSEMIAYVEPLVSVEEDTILPHYNNKRAHTGLNKEGERFFVNNAQVVIFYFKKTTEFLIRLLEAEIEYYNSKEEERLQKEEEEKIGPITQTTQDDRAENSESKEKGEDVRFCYTLEQGQRIRGKIDRYNFSKVDLTDEEMKELMPTIKRNIAKIIETENFQINGVMSGGTCTGSFIEHPNWEVHFEVKVDAEGNILSFNAMIPDDPLASLDDISTENLFFASFEELEERFSGFASNCGYQSGDQVPYLEGLDGNF